MNTVRPVSDAQPELAERLADAERTLAEIAELARSVAVPARSEVPAGELVPLLRGLFASGQKLAIENAQLRATLKSVL